MQASIAYVLDSVVKALRNERNAWMIKHTVSLLNSVDRSSLLWARLDEHIVRRGIAPLGLLNTKQRLERLLQSNPPE